MTVNMQVEPLVREAIAASLAADPGRCADALKAMMRAGGEDAVKDSVHLGLAICYQALLELHGGRPDDEQLEELSQSFVEMNAWADFDQNVVLRFLIVLANQTPVDDVLPAEESTRLVFVMAAWLLAAFPPEEREWTEFLDQILDRLESAPVQQ